MKRVLVIAADADLRRSVQFALEAEGYGVTCRASLAARELPRDFDCTVVDHHVLGSEQRAASAFFEAFAPVILLANSDSHPLSPWAAKTLLKPMLGPALSAAIRDAMASRAVPK
ncbi:MAG: transcriptional regulator [Devosia sp.]